jgi:hypothetical protein
MSVAPTLGIRRPEPFASKKRRFEEAVPVASPRYQRFESAFLQRRVSCEPDFPRFAVEVFCCASPIISLTHDRAGCLDGMGLSGAMITEYPADEARI